MGHSCHLVVSQLNDLALSNIGTAGSADPRDKRVERQKLYSEKIPLKLTVITCINGNNIKVFLSCDCLPFNEFFFVTVELMSLRIDFLYSIVQDALININPVKRLFSYVNVSAIHFL